jgi:hypothetical protein
MKKLVLVLFLGIIALATIGQTEVFRGELVTVVNALAPATISGTDTTIYVQMPPNYSPIWSAAVTWSTITGSGTCAIMTAHSTSYWEAYNTTPSVTLTGANNTYVFEDSMFSGVWLGFLITKGTISAGAVTVTLYVR